MQQDEIAQARAAFTEMLDGSAEGFTRYRAAFLVAGCIIHDVDPPVALTLIQEPALTQLLAVRARLKAAEDVAGFRRFQADVRAVMADAVARIYAMAAAIDSGGLVC